MRRFAQHGHAGALMASLAAALALAAGPRLEGAVWSWELSLDRYQRLNQFERAQYDKAAGQLRQNNYKAAASEFEKFKVQFPDSESLPYILFMIGYCSHQNAERHRAIQIYNEVLDYFGEAVEVAAPALYFMGVAYIDNGDIREGMTYLKEMVEDEDYQKHALAAGALRRLADNEWKNKNEAAAVRYWKQVVAGFSETNHEEANIARSQIAGYYIKSRDYAGYDAWLINAQNQDNVKSRRWVAQLAWDVAFQNFQTDWGKYTPFTRDDKAKDMRALHDYFLKQQVWFEKDSDLWDFYYRAVLFSAHRMADRQESKRLLELAVPLVKALPSEKDRNERWAYMSDRLREAGDYDLASYCVSLMTDPPYAAYKEYEILGAKGRWAEGTAKLELIEKMGNAGWATRAMKERARVYKDILREYEKAIALYRQINEPPDTLWSMQDAYRNWGKLEEALGVLSEIEGSFPDHAANAAWHKVKYLDESGQADKAVAQARRILKVYPKSGASSSAHQLLEKYGLATGGGVFDND